MRRRREGRGRIYVWVRVRVGVRVGVRGRVRVRGRCWDLVVESPKGRCFIFLETFLLLEVGDDKLREMISEAPNLVPENFVP